MAVSIGMPCFWRGVAGGIAYNNGYVGIGTATPSRPLHLVSATSNLNSLFECSDTAQGRVGMDFLTNYAANAGDYFRFNFRGDLASVVETVYDASAGAFKQYVAYYYLTDKLSFLNPAPLTVDGVADEVELPIDGSGLVMNSAGGNRFKITISDAGALVITPA